MQNSLKPQPPFVASILPLAISLFACSTPASSGVIRAGGPVTENRVASVFVSQDFLNEQLALHAKSEMFQDVSVTLDPERSQILLRGIINVPIEELRAVNLDPKLGRYRFQMAVKLSTTKLGHLILEFPLNETYFYAADAKDIRKERVIVPVQMLSLALASARGYLAALSGDFNGFDRRTTKLEALLKALDHAIAHETNADALDDLKTQREALRLQLEAVPIERKQLKGLAKEVGSVLGFTGEKEINLNDELAARKNALVLKVRVSQLAPYLNGIDLGGVRILRDRRDGGGQNFLAIDINAQLAASQPPSADALGGAPPASARPAALKVPPSLVVRLNQALLESDAVVSREKERMGSNLREFGLDLRDDGLHVAGKWHTLLISVPFDTVVDFVATGPDVFEVRLREIKVAGIDFGFLRQFVLESVKKRLDVSLQGICSFKYVGEESDSSRSLQVSVNPKALVPAFPDLHLVDVDVREREFLLKIGKI